MIPDLPRLSDPTISADFISPYNRVKTPLSDWARGGVALLDASKGLNVKDWFCEWQDGFVYLSAHGTQRFVAYEIQGEIEWISFAFDQNMHANFAYTMKGGGSYLYWYDTAATEYVTTNLGFVSTPFLRLDDSRDAAFGECSVILSYIEINALRCRVQNDRYGVEYTLAERAGSAIMQCGMNKKMRFQWHTL